MLFIPVELYGGLSPGLVSSKWVDMGVEGLLNERSTNCPWSYTPYFVLVLGPLAC